MKTVAVIPARMNSSRFPGKPLARICGLSMIEHIYRRAVSCARLDAVFVATCDEEIRRATEAFGGKAIMTSASHERASDRAAEAAERFDADVIVMIQGDEPLVAPDMISRAVEPMLADASIGCVNLVRRIERGEDFADGNTIKVVSNLRGEAIYFSRAPIPSADFSKNAGAPVFKQVCVIPFRRDFLEKFARLAPTPLERAESIDMLRLVEHGEKIRLVEIENDTHAVDTPEDLRLVEKIMETDALFRLYGKTATEGARRR